MVDYSVVLTLVSASGALGKFLLLVVTLLTGKTMFTWNELTVAFLADVPGLVISGELPYADGYLLSQN